nr:receptor-type tyrosine-protein phosphatase epsilon-like isoform X2 [Crassostrea gigas]
MHHLTLIVLLNILHVHGLENLALYQPTWEQYPWPDTTTDFGSENAVDGMYTDCGDKGGQCTISDDGKYNATLRVDLGGVVSISQIDIFYRKDYQNHVQNIQRMAGFFVYVSNTTSKSDGYLCYHDESTDQNMLSLDQHINCSLQGRYVIYYIERSQDVVYPSFYSQYAFNELCEIKVYGCNGTFGDECFYPCPTNCLDRKCDTDTGHCLRCVPGYKGPICNQECDEGSYGINCRYICSHCKEESHCYHINVLCLDGCVPGYKGPFCNISCEAPYFGINCSQMCTNCFKQSCHQVTGVCTSQAMENTGTDDGVHISYIVVGSLGFVVVAIIIVIGIIIYRRVRRTSRDKLESSNTNNANTSTINNISESNLTNIYQNINVENSKAVKRSRKSPATRELSRESRNDDDDIDEKIHNENPYGDVYANQKQIPDILIQDLEKEIHEKSKKENDGFKKEYATLLYGERHPCHVGKLPENITKNRFKTTFPYDHSRVILVNTPSDYINASFIDGLKKEKAYIATQGPKPTTISDFWSMVLQEGIDQIVMLTNLKEGTKLKSAQYWPDLHETITCDRATLHTIKEQQYAQYVVRKIKLSHATLNDSRTITQYHYTAWPDHGTPEPLCLLLFHDHVIRTKPGRQNGPTLVHCSAGIGRTGTYIAIDVLFAAGKTEKKINIAEYVKKMRRNRMNMVQTFEQYKTIFLTLNEMFKAPTAALTKTEFLRKLQKQNKNMLGKEFQKLLSVRPHYAESDYKMSSHVHGARSEIRPLDKYIIYLTSNVTKRESYSNAIVVPSFINQNAFIITHFPAPGDEVDFLRLITDHDCELVVSMEPLHEVESTNQWLPTSTTSKAVSPFTIHLQEDHKSEIKSCRIDIAQKEKSNETWSVNVIEPSSVLALDSSQTVSQILGLVSFAQNITTNNPIIVLSRDGAALCGVFCAVYNLIQQLTMDEEIDVFSVVRLLQTRRPELCSSLEEYRMIHDTLKSFIQSQTGENVYYNQ